MSTRRSLRTRNALTSTPSQSTLTVTSRPRRTTSSQHKNVTIARDSSDSPDGGKKAIHLTVKMPSNKLREATSGSVKKGQSVAERERLEPAEIVSGPRGSRAKKSYVVESDSDDEDGDEDAEGEEVDDEEDVDEDVRIEDQIGEPEQSDDEDEDVEATGLADDDDEDQDEADENEDAEGDEDVEMEDESPMPPPPIIKKTGPASKPSVTITPAQSGKLKSVESKEMEMEDDDEELSSINSGGEEDAEGEDVEMEPDDEEGDMQSLGTGSRGSTPDVSKMTKRQRSRLDQVMGSDDFLQLPMEPQQKKIFTPEEHAMRRAEMARRRKNLSEKRNEEEKMDTINRLLKKQAPKRRGKISAAEINANAAAGDDSIPTIAAPHTRGTGSEDPEPEFPKANPVFVRWVSDAGGCRVGVPGEWLEGPVGGWMNVGGGGKGRKGARGGRLVTEVEG